MIKAKKDSSPNVMILASNAYWPSIGGVENSLRHLADEATALGKHVIIITSDQGLQKKIETTYSTIYRDVEIIRHPTIFFKSQILKPLNIARSFFALLQAFKKLKQRHPEANVIARNHLSAIAAHYAGFSKTVYLVPSVINKQVNIDYQDSKITTAIRNYFFKAFHHLIQKKALQKTIPYVFSISMEKQCQNLVRKQYVIVKPGVDCKRFHSVSLLEKQNLRKELKLPSNDKIVLFVGRFVKAKGVLYLINAIKCSDAAYKLVLVGEGDEYINYIDLIKKLNLEKRVIIRGKTREVEKYYQCADTFVMSSTYEPLGQTILEALATGLSIVAFKRGKLIDTATQELGMCKYIIYSKDTTPSELNSAIEKSFSSIVSSKAISHAACKKFSWSNLLNKLIEID